MDTNAIADLSVDQLLALQKQIAAAKKEKDAQENERLAEVIAPFVEDVVTSGDPRESEKSAWVGFARNGIPVTVDGVEYHVNVTITDVKAKEARVPLFKDKKAETPAETPEPANA